MQRAFLLLVPTCLFLVLPAIQAGDKKLQLTLQSRTAAGEDYKLSQKTEEWSPKQTAIIVCDMWDTHHCYNAVVRVVEIAPRMNEVLEKSRSAGVTIIHAPSSCMEPYKDHLARKNAKDAPTAKNLPKQREVTEVVTIDGVRKAITLLQPGIDSWCHAIPSEKGGKYPIDQSDGGCDSDPVDQAKHKEALIKLGRNPGSPWKSQIDVLKMYDHDIISDSGSEIWNVLEARGINNVIVLGVHTNMCVLGRPFGLRQMAKNGKNVVLMRDMTDTMYNPKQAPYVNHYKGTELIVEHIEKFVCPTITSDQIIGGKAFKFKADPN